MLQFFRYLFIGIMFIMLSACGGGGSTSIPEQADSQVPTAEKNALNKIKLYIENNSTQPIVQDYVDVGVKDVNISTINIVNQTVKNEFSQKNEITKEELKAIINELLNDKNAPIIILLGNDPLIVKTGEDYFDAGATANDDKDGNITANIKIISDVNITKDGVYRVQYNVSDKIGNKAEVVRTVVVREKIMYEDAEDKNTDGWSVITDKSKNTQIKNIYDKERESRVIFLTGIEAEYKKYSYTEDMYSFVGDWNSTKKSILHWSMKFDEVYYLYIIVETAKGERWLKYIPKDTGRGIIQQSYNKNVIIVNGIGSNTTDNQWYTIVRDLNKDIQRYEPDNNFTAMKKIIFHGHGYVDNIFMVNDKYNVSQPIVVEAPGVVLTFDDSFADSWYKIKDIFAEKEVVASFFCNRWAATDNSRQLSEDEIHKFKELEETGNEIAYHTRDHLNTYDLKYKEEEDKADAYLQDQILPGIADMRNHGFEPESFSYPYITGQPRHNTLIRQYLPHIREFFSDVIIIDESNQMSLNDIKKELLRFKNNKDIGVFLGHYIWDRENEPNDGHAPYRIDRKKLMQIIKLVKELGLKFYTLEEAHRIYLNQ